MTWFDTLRDRVDREGQRPHVLESGGGRLLIAEHGARVLACELPGVNENLFFDTSARNDMPVTGGDRLWLAPEVAYFWPSIEDARRDPKGTASVPEAMDPGSYQVASKSGAGLDLSNGGVQLIDRRSAREASVQARRNFALDPSSLMPPEACVSFFYTTEHVVEIFDAPAGFTVGSWSILQVPVTGTLICPTTTRVEPRSYYDPFGDRHVIADDRSVRFLVDGKRRVKMGIRPEHTTWRMGFYRPLGDGRSSLIFRAFAVLPGEPYCDLPRDDAAHDAVANGELPAEALQGDALQAYNDEGDVFGRVIGGEPTFGEMEYHDPCVVAGRGPQTRTGSCVTHVVAGPDAAVREWGEAMLGVPVEPLA